MSPFPRSFVSGPSAFICTAFLLFVTVDAAGPADSTRITAAANVTLRALPSSDAATVAQLPLGTEVSDAGPSGLDKKWIRVRLADNREGWLLSNLTRPLDPVWRWPTFDRIIAERLGRKGDGFAATVELVSFIERVAPEYTDPDGRGRIELARLRALSTAASLVPRTGGRRQPFAAWLDTRKPDVIYDEPGGQWMLNNAMLWDAHARQSKTTSADDIAWLAVTNGLAGECEGELACYLKAHDRLHGEYLRRHPLGKHAAEAVSALKQTLEALGAPAKAGSTFMFDKKSDCRDLSASVDALVAAVQATYGGDKDAVIPSLTALKRLCQ